MTKPTGCVACALTHLEQALEYVRLDEDVDSILPIRHFHAFGDEVRVMQHTCGGEQ